MTAGLFALTYNQIFGSHPKQVASADEHEGHNHGITIDTILLQAKTRISPALHARADALEQQVRDEKDPGEKLHLYHQAAAFWKDTGRVPEPYLWYNAEAARLENSEKKLTFAAHLFLNNLRGEPSHVMKEWKALQSKDLFERSLKLNPQNDSAQIGLGATYLFGEISSNPMEGLTKIRAVAERDSTNVYAQMTLGEASVLSGQLDKAIDRFERVVRIQPRNWEAMLALGDVNERMGNRKKAIEWYTRSREFIPFPDLRTELDKRVKSLSQ